MNAPIKTLQRLRSFVRRQGRMSDSQKQALKDFWPKYGLELQENSYDLNQVFGRQVPKTLEIGFGMGHSLLAMAKQNPQQDFIGIEVHKPGIGTLLMNIELEKISNIRIFCADAVDVLKKSIADNSLQSVQLFFPDPWPKRRHHKRRLVQPEFVKLVCQKLQPGGTFHMATDWQDYAKHMLAVMSIAEGFVNVSGVGQFSLRPDYRPLTKFEQRGLKLGHGVWDLIFSKQI